MSRWFEKIFGASCVYMAVAWSGAAGGCFRYAETHPSRIYAYENQGFLAPMTAPLGLLEGPAAAGIGVIGLAIAGTYLAAGIGLFTHRRWARVIALIWAVLITLFFASLLVLFRPPGFALAGWLGWHAFASGYLMWALWNPSAAPVPSGAPLVNQDPAAAARQAARVAMAIWIGLAILAGFFSWLVFDLLRRASK